MELICMFQIRNDQGVVLNDNKLNTVLMEIPEYGKDDENLIPVAIANYLGGMVYRHA